MLVRVAPHSPYLPLNIDLSFSASYSGTWSPLASLVDLAKLACPELFYDLRVYPNRRHPNNSHLSSLHHHQDLSHYVEGRTGFDALPHDAAWDEEAARRRRETALRERGLLPRNVNQAPTGSMNSTTAAHPTPAPYANRTYTTASPSTAFRQPGTSVTSCLEVKLELR